jgi:act minimal PKS acyl carrier protein
MRTFTVEDLLTTFSACAGEPETTPPSCVLADAEFEDLGYDSLALIGAVTELEQQFDVRIPDGDLAGLKTFGQLAELVNARYASCRNETVQGRA